MNPDMYLGKERNSWRRNRCLPPDRGIGMSKLEERVLIYIALAVVCAFAAVFLGLWAAVLTFVQIAAVIEALYWFGLPKPKSAKYRQHRTLFN
jgi:hypothetical protein